jgi:hypothetical protein
LELTFYLGHSFKELLDMAQNSALENNKAYSLFGHSPAPSPREEVANVDANFPQGPPLRYCTIAVDNSENQIVSFCTIVDVSDLFASCGMDFLNYDDLIFSTWEKVMVEDFGYDSEKHEIRYLQDDAHFLVIRNQRQFRAAIQEIHTFNQASCFRFQLKHR